MKNYELKNKTPTSGTLIKAIYASCICVYIFCTVWSDRLECNSVFVALGGLGVWGAMNEKFVSKAVHENGDGLDV